MSTRTTELRDAVAPGDVGRVRETAHAIKGNSGTVGANRLAALCGDIEQRARAGNVDGSDALVDAVFVELAAVRAAFEHDAASEANQGAAID